MFVPVYVCAANNMLLCPFRGLINGVSDSSLYLTPGPFRSVLKPNCYQA